MVSNEVSTAEYEPKDQCHAAGRKDLLFSSRGSRMKEWVRAQQTHSGVARHSWQPSNQSLRQTSTCTATGTARVWEVQGRHNRNGFMDFNNNLEYLLSPNLLLKTICLWVVPRGAAGQPHAHLLRAGEETHCCGQFLFTLSISDTERVHISKNGIDVEAQKKEGRCERDWKRKIEKERLNINRIE